MSSPFGTLHGLAVDRLVGVDGVLELCAPRREGAGEGRDHADLEYIGGRRRGRPQRESGATGQRDRGSAMDKWH